MTDKYILEKQMPVPCSDLLKWGRWMQKSDRHVAYMEINGVRISTIFLGLDHSFGNGDPVLFETAVFGGPLDHEMERYFTWKQAVAGHEIMCARVKCLEKGK